MDRGAWAAKTVKRPRQQPAQPQYANYWAPLTRKRHTPPHLAQPRHTNHWAPRTRKRHRQEHRPQRPTQCSDPTQRAEGRTGDCPGPRKETTTRRTVTRGGAVGWSLSVSLARHPCSARRTVVFLSWVCWGLFLSLCRDVGGSSLALHRPLSSVHTRSRLCVNCCLRFPRVPVQAAAWCDGHPPPGAGVRGLKKSPCTQNRPEISGLFDELRFPPDIVLMWVGVWAVACRSSCGRLLSVTNAIEAGTCRQGDSGWV